MSDESGSEDEQLEIEYTNDEESSRSSSVAESANSGSKEIDAPP